MKFRLLLIPAIAIGISSCGYDGGYRYECQDPENWEKDYCNPPICLVDNMCTETLLGFDPYAENSTVETVPTEPITEETIAP